MLDVTLNDKHLQERPSSRWPKVSYGVNSPRLAGAGLDETELYWTGFDGTGLDDTRLDGAGLDGARLDGARPDGTGLDGAGLDSAGLLDATFPII